MECKFGRVKLMSDAFYGEWASYNCGTDNKHVRLLESKFDKIVEVVYGGDSKGFELDLAQALANTRFLGMCPSATMDIAVYVFNTLVNRHFMKSLESGKISKYAGNMNYPAPVVKIEWNMVEEDYYYNTETEYHVTYGICDIADNMNARIKDMLRRGITELSPSEISELAEWKSAYDEFIGHVKKTMDSIGIRLKQK